MTCRNSADKSYTGIGENMEDLLTDSLALMSNAELGRVASDAAVQAAELRAAGNGAAALAAESIGLAAEQVLMSRITSGIPRTA
jgi:hypothetical protein